MLKGFVSGEEKDIVRIPMKVGNEYQEGWEVRDNQDRLIWGREDELQTATGTLPFKGYGLPVKVKSLLGNAVQNGTPSPDNIITPEMCGVRTGNLVEGYIPSCNINASGGLLNNPDFNMFYARVEQGKTYCADVNLLGGYFTTIPEVGKTSYDGQRLNFVQSPFTAPITGYLAFRKASNYTTAMMNEGQTLQNYEPYGWAEKITCAGQTTPVYLGEVPTVRRIGKVRLGDLPWGEIDVSGITLFRSSALPRQYGAGNTTLYCDRYKPVESRAQAAIEDYTTAPYNATSSNRMCVHDSRYQTAAAWIADNGDTLLWYILAEPETAISNEPLCKIGSYADELNDTVATLPEIPTTTGQNTLTVETTLAPSSLTVKGHIKELT